MDKADLARPFSIATLAERWNCSTTKVRTLIASGQLPSFRLGKLFRVRAQSVADYEGISLDDLERDRATPQSRSEARPGPDRAQQAQATVPPALDDVLRSLLRAGLPIDRVHVAADGSLTVHVVGSSKPERASAGSARMQMSHEQARAYVAALSAKA